MSNSWKNLLPDSCDWCPLACHANRANGECGACGANDSVLVARHALHFWEEPPISGIIGGPNRSSGPGSGTIFFSNCNMKCAYCQNYEISGTKNNVCGQETSLDQLVDMCLDLEHKGAMNINFVTGTHYRSHIITAVRKAKSEGLTLPIVWNSSGYESLASVYALQNIVDIWLPDFKYASNELAAEFSQNNINNYVDVALEAIDAMTSFVNKISFDNFKENIRMTKGIIVRHLLLPGQLDNSKQALKLLFDNFGNEIKYSIMNQYTPVIDTNSDFAKSYPEFLHSPSEKYYEELLDFADKIGIEDYYWQNGPAFSESFIPDWSN